MARTLLLQIRRRLLVQAFARMLASAILVGAILLVLVIALTPPLSGGELLWLSLSLLGTALLVAAGWSLWKQPSLVETAAYVDRIAKTHDRLVTALEFETQAATSFHAMALTECETFLSRFDFRRWTPWVLPRPALWVVAPLVLIMALQFWVKPHFYATGEPREANAAVLEKAAALETMAKRLEEQAQTEERKAEINKIAEAFRKSAERLREEATGEGPEKAAMRELSALEELLRASEQGSALETLSEALANVDAAKSAADALKKNDPEAAAKALQQLGEALAKGGRSEQELAQMQKAMAQAAQKLGKASPLGSAAQKAASSAERGDRQGVSEAMAQMSQAVRESRSGDGKQNEGGKGNSQNQKMIAALQQMKEGGSGDGQKPQSGEGAGDGKVAMMDASGKTGGDPAQGATSTPGGEPGSEMDQGTKPTPFGAESAPPEETDSKVSLQGLLGEGESLRTLVPARSGEEPAKTGYKALYDAAAPAAEDALDRENIPLGSRRFVKRYFESIRPPR